jgi:hypothetical protein
MGSIPTRENFKKTETKNLGGKIAKLALKMKDQNGKERFEKSELLLEHQQYLLLKNLWRSKI